MQSDGGKWGRRCLNIVATLLLTMGLSVEPLTVQAQSGETQVAAESEKNRIDQLQEAIDRVQKLETYQIRYGYTYIKDHQYTARVRVVGDRSRGIAKIQLFYYGDQGDDLQYQLELMAYDNLNHVYVKQSQLLASMAFFPELSLSETQLSQLAAYNDYYIELSKDQIKQVGLDQDTFSLLFLAPNRRKLAQLSEEKVQNFHGTWMAGAELTDIPEYLFDQTRNLHLDFRLKLDWNLSGKEANLAFNPRLDLVGNAVGLDVQAEVSAKIKQTEFGLNQLAEFATGKVDFLKTMQLKTSPILQKLKRFSLRVNPEQQTYRLSLLGVVEDMNLNLWNNNPAYTRSYDYTIDYELMPSQERLPDLIELKRLSAQEYQSVINHVFSQKATTHP